MQKVFEVPGDFQALEAARAAANPRQPIISPETEERVRWAVSGLVVLVRMAKEYE